MKQAPKATAVTARVEEVKPVTAEEWLGKNTANRNVRPRVVDAYARDMAAGRWRLSGEAVKFSHDGLLLDGQHRLHAVIAADVPVWMMVVRGLDPETQKVMDSGAARTAGDALRLRGETAYSALAAAARLAIAYESGRLGATRDKATHTEILDFIEGNADLRYATDLGASWRGSIDMPQSTLIVGIWRLLRLDAEACIQFFSQLADKTNLHTGDPVLALLNRLVEVRRSNRRLNQGDYLSLIFRAWNYKRARKNVTSLPVTIAGGSIDIPEPR